MSHQPKQIAAYTHPGERSHQEPDTTPGNYYVSAVDSDTNDLFLALGPFPDNHAQALSAVDEVWNFYLKHGGTRAHFMRYGTVRMAPEVNKPGNVNAHLGHLLPSARAAGA